MLEPVIDTGDQVYHSPSDEYWVVAYVEGNKLAWLGWPEGEADLADCKLISKCSSEFREDTLKNMSASTGKRGNYARNRLSIKL